MSVKELQEALDGPKGSLDAYLEVRNDEEIRADIRSLSGGASRREHFAAMAMQGVIAGSSGTTAEHIPIMAAAAVRMADALLTELSKAQP